MNADLTAMRERAKRAQEREERIGISRSLVDLCLNAAHEAVLEKPMVSMKELCSDFVVREVSPATGKALFLEGPLPTPADVGGVPVGHKRSRQDRAAEAASATAAAASDALSDEKAEQIRHAFRDLVSEEELAALLAMIAQDEPKVVITSVTEKPKRALIHAAVKACFAGSHISTTENGSVAVVKATAADRREERRRSNPLRSRPYLHFTLYKEDMDSAHAFRALAKSLHVSVRQFQYSGTKDRRAVTLQRVAIRDLAPARLAVVNEHTYGHSKMKVCSFTEEPEGLRLGDALGNRFEVVLRYVPTAATSTSSVASDAWLQSVERCLSTVGTVNYYGPQRFGTTKVLTSDVGLLLLRGEFDAALYQCVESKSCFTPQVADALAPLKAHRYDEALEKLPHFCYQERDMVSHLVTSPNDFVGAFLTLPRTLAMLYFHAVQSLAWNMMASARLADASRLRAEVGDLVLEEVYARRVAARDANTAVSSTAPRVREGEQALPAVRRLGAEDPLECFSLADVLLPVPGPDAALVFPTSHGCSKADYQRTLAELGVQDALLPAEGSVAKDIGRTNALIKVFHFHGTYRPLCVVPEEVSLTHTVVSSWDTPANRTDLETVVTAVSGTVDTAEVSAEVAPSAQDESSRPCTCLVARFTLPPGSYATSVLREFATLCVDGFQTDAQAGEADEAETDDTPAADATASLTAS